MRRLTLDKYECAECHKIKQLVICRGRAWLCESCYENMLEKRRIIKEINKLLR